MKILYAIQGTGNGHLSRAQDVIPILQKKCDLDILISGTQTSVKLDHHIKYPLHGMSFTFGKKGGIDYWDTFKNIKFGKFFHNIYNLPLNDYDLIINDYEPITAWGAKLRGLKCIALSHQCSLHHPDVPTPPFVATASKFIMKHYVPTNEAYGFHFKRFGSNIYTPLVRQPIRNASTSNKGHITVYLPAYGIKAIHNVLKHIPGQQFEVFTKYTSSVQHLDNVTFIPPSKERFVSSICNSKGVLCNAGFETPSETLYLGKKLLVIPMKGQVEQHYNAACLETMGIPTMLDLNIQNLDIIKNWLEDGNIIEVDYPDETAEIIDRILAENL